MDRTEEIEEKLMQKRDNKKGGGKQKDSCMNRDASMTEMSKEKGQRVESSKVVMTKCDMCSHVV